MELKKEDSCNSFDTEVFIALVEEDECYWKKLEGFRVYTKIWGEGIIKEITVKESIRILVNFVINGEVVDKRFNQEAISKSFYKIEGKANWQDKKNLKAIYQQKLYEYDLLRHNKMKIEDNLSDLRPKEKEFKKLIRALGGPYYSHCFRCKDEITDELEFCFICGWFKCRMCGSCGCNFWRYDTVHRSAEEKSYSVRLKETIKSINIAEVERDKSTKRIESVSKLLNILKKRIS